MLHIKVKIEIIESLYFIELEKDMNNNQAYLNIFHILGQPFLFKDLFRLFWVQLQQIDYNLSIKRIFTVWKWWVDIVVSALSCK